MNTTPLEEQKLSELLQRIMVSGSHDSALYSQQYYTLVKEISTRPAIEKPAGRETTAPVETQRTG